MFAWFEWRKGLLVPSPKTANRAIVSKHSLGIVSYVGMAANARYAIAVALRGRPGMDLINEVLMTVTAVVLDNAVIVCMDPNVVGKLAGRKGEGVEEAVARLAVVLADEIMGRVAVVAGRKLAVGRMSPRA